jgi:hypothetical protein
MCQFIHHCNLGFIIRQAEKLNINHTNKHLIFQLMHTTLKNVDLLKHIKVMKAAPTCFGLQGNHHQGATVST